MQCWADIDPFEPSVNIGVEHSDVVAPGNQVYNVYVNEAEKKSMHFSMYMYIAIRGKSYVYVSITLQRKIYEYWFGN